MPRRAPRGQACILYGAAEFSRDTDFAVLASPDNLTRLRRALDDLMAEVIAVPPFEPKYLRRGHAVHVRCRHPEALGMRVDVIKRRRPLLGMARPGQGPGLAEAIAREEWRERRADSRHWAPLTAQLAALRLARVRGAAHPDA